MSTDRKAKTLKLVLLALLTAIVIVLQTLAGSLPVYPFTLTLVLIPMVIGAALISALAGAWLGAVFGAVVLLTGNAGVFLAFNPAATIATVLLKGALAGLAAGAAYKLLEKRSKTVAVTVAAIVCPVVNTGIFILASYVFFMPVVLGFAEAFGFVDALGAPNATATIFIGLVGINFPLELGVNLVLSPVIVRLTQYGLSRQRLQ